MKSERNDWKPRVAFSTGPLESLEFAGRETFEFPDLKDWMKD